MSVEGESRGFLGLFLDPAVDPKRPFLGLEGLHISFLHFTITITSNIIMKKTMLRNKYVPMCFVQNVFLFVVLIQYLSHADSSYRLGIESRQKNTGRSAKKNSPFYYTTHQRIFLSHVSKQSQLLYISQCSKYIGKLAQVASVLY